MKFKRHIAGLLAGLMVLSLGSVTAFAEDEYDSPEVEVTRDGEDFSGTYWNSYWSKTYFDGELYVTYCQANVDLDVDSITQAQADQAVKEALATCSKEEITCWISVKSDSNIVISKAMASTIASRPAGIYEVGFQSDDFFYEFDNFDNVTADFDPRSLLNFTVNTDISKKLADAGVSDYVEMNVTKCQANLTVAQKKNDKAPTEVTSYKYVYLYNSADGTFEAKSNVAGGAYGGWYSIQAMSGGLCGNYILTNTKLPTSIASKVEKTMKTTDITDTAFYTDLAADLTQAVKDGEDLVFDAVDKDGKEVTEVPDKVMEAYKAAGAVFKTYDPESGAEWEIDTIDKAIAFDRRVEVGAKVEAVNNVLSSVTLPSTTQTLTLDFKHVGELPGKAKIKLTNVNLPDTENGYVYYFNTETKLFDKVGNVKIVDGICTIEISHCSDYVITTEKLPSAITSDKETASTAANTGDSTTTLVFVLALIAGAAVLGYAVYTKKRNA